MSERTCRECGCSQFDACVTEDGPCHWVEADLCSRCAAGRFPAYRQLAGGIHRQDVMGGDWTKLTDEEADALLRRLSALE